MANICVHEFKKNKNQNLMRQFLYEGELSDSAVPTLFGIRDQFLRRRFFHRPGIGEDGLGMIQVHCIYHALYSYYYRIVIYNEIIVQLTIMQNQWEPWACFPATRWSHLRVTGDNDTWSVLLMSSLPVICFWLLLLQKTLLHKDRLSETEAGFSVLLWRSQAILPWF